MMFADKYLLKNKNKAIIECDPEVDLGIIVVIPCFREPEIIKTLESLKRCDRTVCGVEVIVLINQSERVENDIIVFNEKTRREIDEWIEHNAQSGLNFYAVGPVTFQKKWAGAGLARKKGMDEATRRFNLSGKEDGLIVSLDADTLVEKNYLTEIEKHFHKNLKHVGATLQFNHQKNNLGDKQKRGIELYENYLDYYKRALDYTSYPYSMFTIGSAFTVKALAYVKRGGMNRRQAGEDFYFLQNLVQIGEVGEISTTRVYPSARLSDRVPFGTGPVLKKWMNGEEDLSKSYNFEAFVDLKKLFQAKDQLYKIDVSEYKEMIDTLPVSVATFLDQDNFWDELFDLNRNCSSLQVFQSRFFQKFNAFKILKYLNFAHEQFYEKADLEQQIELLNKEQ